MKKAKKLLGMLLASVMVISTAACGDKTVSTASLSKEQETSVSVDRETEGDNFIRLALNVYYNDAEKEYYKNEKGPEITVTGEGEYTVSFDCATDLSDEAKEQGVDSLKNLTAVYILDAGVADGEQSSLTAANIMFTKITVDDTDLTITQESPKSAFKSTGVFDTNDPINGWDGSLVEEVSADSNHAANFTTVDNPTKISVTFKLTDMVWGEKETETAEAVISDNAYENTAVFSDLDFSSIDALTLTKYMGNGINLGNTMEAYGHLTLGTKANVSAYETSWGQPVTTAEMFKAMKNCGFDTVRIPVAWTNMMDYESGDYTIDSALLDRVEEIVNYALDAEMFVIINDHWDGSWWGMFGSKTPETVDKAWAMYESMWTQIAVRFADYSDMLIFESANEELGDRLNDKDVATDSGALKTDEEKYEMTNAINQKFVDVVRSTGGNNSERFLLIAGYNTNFDKTIDDKYKMPEDSASGSRLLLSVHYYDPWNYCGTSNQANWGLKSEYEYMNKQFKKLTKFTDAGYGVIIGEYGALPFDVGSDGSCTLKTNTAGYTANLLDNCDLYNYVPVLWSCNDLFNKLTLNMASDEVTALYTGRCYAEESKEGDAYLTKVEAEMTEALEAAPEMWEGVETYEAGTPVAWIMWNGGAGTYSVGDTFNPADNTEGITATNVVVDGAGEYTVSLDFAGGNTGLTFAALGIADGEVLYPTGAILIEEITLNGEKYELKGTPYTSSDDGKCMRVNLYNSWVTELPADARTVAGGASGATPCILDPDDLENITNITVKFRLIIK